MKFTHRMSIGLIALLVLGALPAFAAVTGNLYGVVTDSSGAALPGVTVTATSPVLQGARTTVTNEAGEYHLQLLPPGIYRVELSLSGLSPVVKENVSIGLDQTTKLNVPMQMGTVTEAITVTAEAVVVDPTQTTVQQNFGQQHLKYATIGQAGRSYQSVLQQAAGVGGAAGGNPQVMGANLGQNNYMLDGVNTTDPVTHTFGSNLPFDAIQEVSIMTLGKDAEYGRAVGGVVNVVTKTGGNEFTGTLDARITNEDLSESGDHFDADSQNFQNFVPSATLGGPIQRDKIWFFASVDRPDTARDNTARPGANWAPGTRTFRGWDSLAKITATPAANHTLSFRFTDNRADIEHSQDDPLFRPEADSLQTQESTIYNLGYDLIINPQWLASAQVGLRRGFLETRPMTGDLDTVGITNNTTGVRWAAYTNHQGGDRNRDELIASTTYFWNGMGSHTFKVGLNLDQSEFSSFNNVTGLGVDQSLCSEEFGHPAGSVCGATQINLGGGVNDIGTNRRLTVTNVLPTETYESDLQAYYLQDEWHPVTPVTLRLGLRYETVDFSTPGADTPTLDKLQPRIGAAWDLFNNSNTILHGFWGDVMDDNGLSLASFLSQQGAVSALFDWSASTNSWVYLTSIGGPTGNEFDEDLQPTYGREMNVGITQRIWTNTSLDVTAIWRETRDIFEDACADEECHFFSLTNHPHGLDDALRGEYQAYIAKIETRPFTWLSGLFSYTYSTSEGSVEYTQNAGADFDVAPDHVINRFGFLSDDARHRIKASGFARAPFGTTFGFDFNYRTGLPRNVTANLPPTAQYGTLFVEPRGSRRTPDLTQLDLQVQHEINVGRVRMGLIGAIFNVLNSETALTFGNSIGNYANCRPGTDAVCIDNPLAAIGYDTRPGFERLRVSSTSFDQELTWQRPRRYEVGVRFEF